MIQLNKITPYVVFSILIIYILNGYKVINISEIIYGRSVNTELSGESKFIDFFLFYLFYYCTKCKLFFLSIDGIKNFA